jgi:hypothetical protein
VGLQVRDFWHALEAATNERQQAMFRLLNRHLKRLAQRVEVAVGEALEVQLEPAALHLDPPTAQQFHADLQDLFDTGAHLTPPSILKVSFYFRPCLHRGKEVKETVIKW